MELETEYIIHSESPDLGAKKITELTVDYVRNDYYTDENGNRYRAPTEHTSIREVQSASHNKRTLNFLIDNFLILILAYLFALILEAMFQYTNFQFDRSISLILLIPTVFFAYYYFFEFYLQKTIGKFLTNTIVIDEYANRPTRKQILWRTFYRIPSFYIFNFYWKEYMGGDKFCHGLHDRKTTTWVVPMEEFQQLKKMLQEK
ncbi:MAG: RDD family protein [Moheibacter sp.]